MFITNSGDTIEAGKLEFLAQLSPSVPVSSMTFSGLNGDADRVYAVSMYWKNPITGAVSLQFQPNGLSAPSGSTMVLTQFDAVTGLTFMASADSTFSVGNLGAGPANTFLQGAAFFAAASISADGSPVGRAFKAETYAEDGAVLLGDKRTHAKRTGFWKDSTTQVTSITIATSTGGAAIDAGSDFRLWKVL